MITLRIKHHPSIPLEAESISPDRMTGQSNDAIRAMPIFLGKASMLKPSRIAY